MYTVIGIVFGSFLGYLLGRYAWWVNIKFTARNIFFKAFENELLILRKEGDCTVYLILYKAFDSHQLAINEFGRYLSERNRMSLEREWKTYYKNPNKDGKRLQQYESSGNREESEHRRKLALANLEKVLEFSKHKFSLF